MAISIPAYGVGYVFQQNFRPLKFNLVYSLMKSEIHKVFFRNKSRPKVRLAEDVAFFDDTVKEKLEGPKKPRKDIWEPEKEPTGFFPPSTAKKSVREGSTLTIPTEEKAQTPSSPIRFGTSVQPHLF